MQLIVHLSFDGGCEAAFQYYQRVLGGEITALMKYRDSPMAAQVGEPWQERIIHATLRIGDVELAGADAMPGEYRKPQGFSVILNQADLASSERVFQALAEGGEVLLPFQATFWSAGFGVLVDRYGVPWEVNCALPPQSA